MSSYIRDRARFLAAAKSAGVSAHSEFECPSLGPDGEKLYMDVVYFGAVNGDLPSDQNILVLSSAVHGNEYGPEVQIELLENGFTSRVPKGVGVCMIFCVNPSGRAWGERTDHDNIDVNRAGGLPESFIPKPDCSKYDSLLYPQSWSADAAEAIEDRIRKDKDFAKAIIGGQYHNPQGLLYGGQPGECWSINTLKDICESFLSRADRVAMIDTHTGAPVPYMEGEIYYSSNADDAVVAKIRKWYGADVGTIQATGGYEMFSEDVTVFGAMRRFLPPSVFFIPVVMEMGTGFSADRSLVIMAAANYYRQNSGIRWQEDESMCEIRYDFLELFAPDDPCFEGAMYCRIATMCRSAVLGLASCALL